MKVTFDENETIESAVLSIHRILETVYQKGFSRGVAFQAGIQGAELVRCKDCKHKPTGSGVNHDIEFPDQDYKCPCRCAEDFWYSRMSDDDWFCGNGERK